MAGRDCLGWGEIFFPGYSKGTHGEARQAMIGTVSVGRFGGGSGGARTEVEELTWGKVTAW